jgi:hypothetical protein
MATSETSRPERIEVKTTIGETKMLSTNTRLKLEDIAARIAGGLNVSLEEMQWATKWSQANRSAAAILRKARRRAINGEPAEGSLDELLEGLDLGSEDPSDHLTSESTAEDIYNFFKRDDRDERLNRD